MQSQVGLPLANYSQPMAGSGGAATRSKRSLPNLHGVGGVGKSNSASSRKVSSPPNNGSASSGHSVQVDVHTNQDYENFR